MGRDHPVPAETWAGARPIAKKHPAPEHALDADGGNFDERPVAHFIGDGEHTPIRKVDVGVRRAVHLKRTAGHPTVHVQMPLNACVVNGWQRGEKAIV
jgi:hypothetical protein